ncbi:MAG: polyprenyl synthetase family protein [Anaerolineae bacterium]|nr:polyprenyl synthetase family protein [Anaerolineae bacterium]
MDVQSFIDRYIPALEAEMRDVVSAPRASLHDLYGYLRYHLEWVDERFRPIEGRAAKRLRPVFCLLACEACGGDWESALPAAAAVELLHNFSLIHDDIEDQDRTRRGRPTVWAVWGEPQAINAGDALFTLAHLALLRLAGRGAPADVVLAALDTFDRTCLALTEGQFLDIGFETRDDVTPEAYLEMVAGKTAALIGAACELGALVAGAPAARRARLSDFARELGLAFQMQDDVLGIWGDPQVTGKPVGADIRRRKKTLPIVYGLAQSTALQRLLARPTLSDADVAQAIAVLESTGSRDWTEAHAREATERSLEALGAATLSGPAADALYGLALDLLGRAR